MTAANAIRAVALRLATAQILVWAGSFYLFPALLPSWEAAQGWSKAELSGAFTAALLLSAAGAPVAGRIIDRGHARSLFAVCFIGAGLTLLLLARVTTLWQFYACWLLLGLSMAGTLYEACFALLTRCYGAQAQRAITIVTLVAGFAGSVSFPLAQTLTRLYDWRVAVNVFAVAVLAIATPLALGAAARALREPAAPVRTGSGAARARSVGATLRTARFWLLCLAFVCIALDHGLLLTHLLPLLASYGLQDDLAVLAAAAIGPMQVLGRIAMVSVERFLRIERIALISFIFLIVAAVSLLGVRALPLLVVPFVVLHGSGYGVTSITRPVVTAHLLGRDNFGALSGFMALPFMAAFALAPTVAALLWSVGGYDLVVALAVFIGVSGLLLYAGALRLHARTRS